MTNTFFVRVAPLLLVVVLSACSPGPTAPSRAAGTANPPGTHTLFPGQSRKPVEEQFEYYP